MADELKKIAKIVWREGRFPKLWTIFTALPGIVQKVLDQFNVNIEAISPYLPEPAWWWGLIVLALWSIYVMYSMGRKLLSYETPAIEIRPFRSAIDGSWWVDVENTGMRPLASCVLNLERLENEKGDRVFPQAYGLSGRPRPFPLRGQQTKQARLASLLDSRIVLHLLDDDGERPTRLEDVQYTAVLSVTSEAEGAHSVKGLRLLGGDDILSVS